ncbi:MAG: hypothetical protein E7653_05500 [Ruminococcaceae bacterium]|nr:hypothetical protein [Oscillospiraceae bacterium]
MKRNKVIDFLTVTLFFGILLSFMIYTGIETLMQYERNGAVSIGEQKGGFNSMFYEDENLDGFVKSFDYRVFGQTGSADLIVGKDDWLFEVRDTQSGYERLLDYIGGNQFDDKQLERAHKKITDDKKFCEDNGAKYVLVVVPDAITVCSDKVPSYLGLQSENTRRAQLNRYLAGVSESAFVDPTQSMIEANEQLCTYNNTENSINAYGAYVIYEGVMRELDGYAQRGVVPIAREDVEFFTRLTDGKSVAVRAGLDKTVKNRTVSLTDKMEYDYKVVGSSKGAILTRMNVASNDMRVIVECADDWDRTQLTPYFSNTFYEVVYTSGEDGTRAVLQKDGADIVIRLVHEGELGYIAK